MTTYFEHELEQGHYYGFYDAERDQFLAAVGIADLSNRDEIQLHHDNMEWHDDHVTGIVMEMLPVLVNRLYRDGFWDRDELFMVHVDVYGNDSGTYAVPRFPEEPIEIDMYHFVRSSSLQLTGSEG